MTPAATSSRIDRTALARAGLSDYVFIEALAALPFVEAVWIYGSRARGDFRARSDVDLAVEAPSASAADWQRLFDLLDEADSLLGIDCVRLDTLPEHDRLRVNILRDGIALYRNPSA